MVKHNINVQTAHIAALHCVFFTYVWGNFMFIYIYICVYSFLSNIYVYSTSFFFVKQMYVSIYITDCYMQKACRYPNAVNEITL